MELPVLERPIDNTALSDYTRCPRKFFFGMVLHRRKKKDEIEKAALSFGSLWHKILELHYKSNGDPTVVMQAIESWEGNIPGDHRTFQRAMMDYQKYVKTWDSKKDLAETIGAPDNPMVEIKAEVHGPEIVHPYAGKIDRGVSEIQGQNFIEDHKTTSRLTSNYFDQFVQSNQMRGYTYIGRKLAPTLDIVGVRINLYHVLKNDTNFHRRVIMYSDSQMKEWADNYNTWTARMRLDYWAHLVQHEGMDPDQLGLDPHLVDYLRTITPYPAHFGDNGCSGKYGFCTYFGVCSSPPSIQMKALEHDFDILEWNPLEVEDEEEV